MFLVTHAAIAAVLADRIGLGSAAAFAAGWASHYLADAVPHGDEQAGDWARRKNEVRRYALLAGIDAVILAAALASVFLAGGFDPAILAAAAGATVPDVLWGVEKTLGRTIFGPHLKFHHRVHNLFGWRLPLWSGLMFQTALAAFCWYAAAS